MHVNYLSTGPIIALCLARTNAVKLWQELMGPEKHLIAKQSAPTSLRAIYGDVNDEFKSAVYGTALLEDVPQELHYFFPNSKIFFLYHTLILGLYFILLLSQ